MKKLLCTLPLLALTTFGTQGQGYVMFNNIYIDPDPVVEAYVKRVADINTGDYLTSAYHAQLFAGPNGSLEAVLTAVAAVGGPAPFADSPPDALGEFLGFDLAIAGSNPGDIVSLQVRAFPSIYATWIEAYNAALIDPNVHVGKSTVFTLALGTQFAPTEMVFNMPLFTVGIIPEPSVMAMGGLGLGMLFLRRRKS